MLRFEGEHERKVRGRGDEGDEGCGFFGPPGGDLFAEDGRERSWMKQMEKDVRALESMEVIDYSLLLGVVRRKRRKGGGGGW